METIKKEKKADLEQLLNSLIEKGWKPRGYELDGIRVFPDRKIVTYMSSKGSIYRKYRELVSKESGLWQFVCENGMVKMKEGYYWQNIALIHSEEYDYCDCEYRLIETSLKNEDELEQFLLDNIIINEQA